MNIPCLVHYFHIFWFKTMQRYDLKGVCLEYLYLSVSKYQEAGLHNEEHHSLYTS
jgi:hypothetical protein